MPQDGSTQPTSGSDSHLQEVNQEIYKHNLELAVVNKTLSLLKKLYQISLLALEPAKLAEQICEPVRADLNLETTGVMAFDESTDTLSPYTFSKSPRLLDSLTKQGFMFKDYKIKSVSNNSLLHKVIFDKAQAISYGLSDIWGGVIDAEKLKTVSEEAHIKTLLVYPLLAQEKVIGILILGLNRQYETLSNFEQESIKSCVDVIAVALDKALLYEQLKAANKQLKVLDQARAEFITIASHQLRTPPTTIKWYLASLLAGDFGKFTDEQTTIIDKANRTNNSLIGLIDDMLNVSRIERGKMEFLFKPTDMLDLANITYEQLIPLSKEKGLELVFNTPKYKPPIIMADGEKVRQVMNNLIDNALKYTKAGSVTVNLSANLDEIKFSVKDTGKGIGPTETEAIFDKFSRGKESIKQSAGLGLGLYVAKVIIEQHKGKIWAESEGEGKGSSFIFTLPINNGLKETTLVDLTKSQEG